MSLPNPDCLNPPAMATGEPICRSLESEKLPHSCTPRLSRRLSERASLQPSSSGIVQGVLSPVNNCAKHEGSRNYFVVPIAASISKDVGTAHGPLSSAEEMPLADG